jgi:hypothetical protein
MANTLRSVAWSLAGILLCGGLGGAAGFAAARALDVAGLMAALVAVPLGMVVAVGCWIGLTALLTRAGLVR